MSDHRHAFAVDAACECGVLLSTLVQSQRREIERLEAIRPLRDDPAWKGIA